MRDTLLLVLAAIGGSVLISVACAGMWIAGNACVDRYDRIVAERAQNARFARAEERVRAIAAILDSGHRPEQSIYAEGFTMFATVDELIADSARRAGARGESDG